MGFNIAGTLTALRLPFNPSLFLPSLTISNFGELPIPIPSQVKGREVKVVILDKDNCFAKPHTDYVHGEYKNVWDRLKSAYPHNQLLIVSNTAGSKQDDKDLTLARAVESNTGVNVLPHATKKPGCGDEILSYLKKNNVVITHPAEIVIIGDRLMTDVALANIMKAQSIWVRNGVTPSNNLLTRFEMAFYDYMTK